MRVLVDRLSTLQPVDKRLSAEMLNGSWELAYTTVQLFRASPFFQMASSWKRSRAQPFLDRS